MRKYMLPLLYILASLLAIYGQSLAYFITDHLIEIDIIYCLTGLTIISIGLFIVFSYRSFFLYIKNNDSDGGKFLVITLGITGAVLMSLWSLFVLIMWWG